MSKSRYDLEEIIDLEKWEKFAGFFIARDQNGDPYG